MHVENNLNLRTQTQESKAVSGYNPAVTGFRQNTLIMLQLSLLYIMETFFALNPEIIFKTPELR